MDIVKVIFRELSKLLMFALLWAFPLYLFKITGTGGYLFFFLVSAFGTFSVFSHYEALSRIEANYVEPEDEIDLDYEETEP